MNRSSLKSYFLVIILSFLPLISILFTNNLFHTHDGFAHIPRIAAYVKALKDGEFPVRWVGDLNFGYGMPLFNFIYPLPYLVSSLFVFAGVGLSDSYRLSIALSFLLSGVFMYGFSSLFFKDWKKSFLVTIFYQFTTFHLVDLLVRGDFGETYAFAFFPLVLWGIARLFEKQNYKNLFLTSIATGLMIISHNGLSLLFFGFVFLFTILFSKTLKTTKYCFVGLFLGLLLSGFYWIPALMEHKYTYADLYMKDRFREHFPPLVNFFIPNLTESVSLMTKGIAVQFGLFQTIAVVVATLILFRKKLELSTRKMIILNLVIIVLCIFIMQPISTFVWEHISILRQFQFPWRFLSLIVVAVSFSSVAFMSFPIFKNKIIFWILIVLILTSSIAYWKPFLGYDKITDSYWWSYPLDTTYFGETDLIWSEGHAKAYPKKPVEVASGEAQISNFKKKTTIQTFYVDAKVPSKIVSHTQFYPGWRVFVNNVEVPIQFQDANWRGQITFSVPSGKNKVRIVFSENKLRLIADLSSLMTLIVLIIILIPKIKTNEKK